MTTIDLSKEMTGLSGEHSVLPLESALHHGTSPYVRLEFDESGDSELVHEAWRTHAEGYLAMGFVNETALTDEGFLPPDIDKARGKDIKYYLIVDPLNDKDRGTVRMIGTPHGSYKDLPAYSLCKDSLNPTSEALLQTAEDQGKEIKEIGALAVSSHGHPIVAHELFRTILHEGMANNEAWFFSIVSTTYDSLVKSFGSYNFKVMGSDIKFNDSRVSDRVSLRPVFSDPTGFIENIYRSYNEAETFVEKSRFKRSLVFMLDGLDKALMNETIERIHKEIVGIPEIPMSEK